MTDTVKVRVRVTIEYEIEWPKDYSTKEQIEFRRNEGTYCWDNFADEMQELMEKQEAAGSCMCHLPGRPKYEVLHTPTPSKEKP